MGIRRDQALDCLRSDDLIGIGMEADAVRRRLCPEDVVSYVVGATICCGGFSAAGGATGTAADPVAQICEEIRHALDAGCTSVRLRGWCSERSALETAAIEPVLRALRKRFPSLWMEAFSAAEILQLARESGQSSVEMIVRLRDAGLDSIADSGLAVDPSSATAPQEMPLLEWAEVHRAAHRAGMRTTAAFVFGAAGEDSEADRRRVDSLVAVRQLQEETGGFVAFEPRSFAQEGGGTGYAAEEPTAVEFLKTLAVSRMMLDNIESVQAGGAGAGRGLKVLQTGLRFGAEDAGWLIVPGEKASGIHGNEEDLRRVIRDAGFRPVERHASYRAMFVS